jgi:hypothetical protein
MKGLLEPENAHYAAVQCAGDIFEIYFAQICNLTTSDVSLGTEDPNQVLRIGIVELVARALIQHVGINPVGPEQ